VQSSTFEMLCGEEEMRSRHNESKDDLLQRREFNTAASEDAICGTGASVVARSRSEQ
jgi:hypothetical protein